MPSPNAPDLYESEAAWKRAVAHSDVRVQWDPDHAPLGQPGARRAIQLGLRGEVLRRLAQEWPLAIEDISAFARRQHAVAKTRDWSSLELPREDVYPLREPAVARALRIASEPSDATVRPG